MPYDTQDQTAAACENYGASPNAIASENSSAIQAALNRGGLVTITTPGVYRITADDFSPATNSSVFIGPGVSFSVNGETTYPTTLFQSQSNVTQYSALNTAYIAGDSLGSNNWIQTAPTYYDVGPEGAHEWGNALAGRPLNIIASVAAAGKTAQEVIDEQLSTIIAARPGYCFVSAGHNDLYSGGVSGAVTFGRIRQIVIALLGAGITPIFSTVWARSYSASVLPEHLDCNARIRQFAYENNVGIFWDGFAATVDYADSTDTYGRCVGKSGIYYDSTPSIHLNNLGGYIAGKRLAEVLRNNIRPRFILPAGAEDQINTANSSNLLSNPVFLGSSGTGTNASGTIPTDWTVDWATRTGSGTATVAVTNYADSHSGQITARQIEITIAGTPSSGDIVRITQPTGFNTAISGGDEIYAECGMQLVNPTAVDIFSMRVLTNNTESTWWGLPNNAAVSFTEGMSVIARTRPMTVSGSGAASAARFDVRVRFNGNGAGTIVRLWQPRVAKTIDI